MDSDWYTAWGFWVGLGGLVAGVIGIGFGVWARNNPKSSRLVCRISESPLMQGVETAKELRVTLGGYLVPNPYLVRFAVTNIGPEDLNPSAFAGGYLRFSSHVPTDAVGDDEVMMQTMSPFSLLESTTPVKHGYEPNERLSVDVLPCQLKVGEVATVTLLISGTPEFVCEHRLTSFQAEELRGDKPSEYELTVDLPGPFGRIPVTWRRKRP